MRNKALLISVFCFAIVVFKNHLFGILVKLEIIKPNKETCTDTIVHDPNYGLDELTIAMIAVESRGDSTAVGDTHLGQPSIGILQIRPIMVKEVNKILDELKIDKRYTLSDRYSRIKSIEMFNIWRKHHHAESDYQKIARNWNGGPDGFLSRNTIKYWHKVKNELIKLSNPTA